MIAIASLLLVLLLSLIILRVASEALILTGLSREAARFQARSAWTGTGFTTAESELVVARMPSCCSTAPVGIRPAIWSCRRT